MGRADRRTRNCGRVRWRRSPTQRPWAATRRSPATSVDAPFGKALVALGAERPDIVGLSADLAKYTDILPFQEAFPERFFNVGMAEQNLVAIAAGLARTGRVPFATTYGVFASRRAFDFVAIAVAHSNMPVKIVAGLPGLTTSYGGTHQAIEDTGLMSLIPGLVVIDPCDATEIAAATRAIAAHPGPGLHAALTRQSAGRVRSRRLRLRNRQGAKSARRRRRRLHRDRFHDGARARRRRRLASAGSAARACCMCRR